MPSQFALVLIVLFAIYMGYEVWRWFSGNPGALTEGQLRRRVAGAVFLAMSLLLAYLEPVLTEGQPVGARLAYLFTAMAFAVVAMILAVREAGFVMRQYARWRREVLHSMAARDPAQPGDAEDADGAGDPDASRNPAER